MVTVAIIWIALVTVGFAIMLAFVLLEARLPSRWARYLPRTAAKPLHDHPSTVSRYKRLRHAMIQT
jgi:hypothetical protein